MVIVSAAHDDYRETLRGAGGRVRLPGKTGRSDAYVSAALKAITPRLEAMFQLLVNHPVDVRTQALGLQWMLRALLRMKATGRSRLRDDWGTYRVDVEDGRPVAAVSEIQQRKVTGLAAFVRMMVATSAHGTFDFGKVPPPGPGEASVSMEELILKTCDTLKGGGACQFAAAGVHRGLRGRSGAVRAVLPDRPAEEGGLRAGGGRAGADAVGADQGALDAAGAGDGVDQRAAAAGRAQAPARECGA